MKHSRNKSIETNIGIGTLKIFKPASSFRKLRLKSISKRRERYEYTPWVLCDEIFISRNERLIQNPLVKYEHINSFTKIKKEVPVDIINQYNVYKREFIKVDNYKEKIMKKIA